MMRIIFSKGYTENWSRKIFVIDSVLKTNPWTQKIKDLNREKTVRIFYQLINQNCTDPINQYNTDKQNLEKKKMKKLTKKYWIQVVQ